MDIQKAFYEQKFENEFIKAKGTAFQDLFNKLMGIAYKGDFIACRPWGNRGDRKNDGFLRTERRLFQVYAPYEMSESKAIKKIEEDFEGAKEHWGVLFDKWVFAHNAIEGLPPHVHKTLLEFQQDNPDIVLETWGWEEFLIVFKRLKLEDLQSWFGNAPTEEAKDKLGFKDLQVILEAIEDRGTPDISQVKEVPKGKIEANSLSDNVAILLKEGMVKAPLVEEFFSKWHDPMFGERIAESFRVQYELLRDNHTPNQIFSELQAWIGGSALGTPEHQLAVLTIMAYYFESCEIYEEPREDIL
ncbi:MAG: hypothetical protein C4575_00715 [Desulforudis sp.]|jgi:hypothetical protein|nr:MAG: hypothetical protein C4575_00715 [Desulforudis sp.]